MNNAETTSRPLVSIIITCYNQGHYLGQAIESVLQQRGERIELIVIDDGSTDQTGRIAASFERIRYYKQQNKGLSAARNLGLDKCNGSFVTFLDADDWLLPDSISTNLNYHLQQTGLAFVSGGHIVVDEEGNVLDDRREPKPDHFFNALLERNIIGMHATVMYNLKVTGQFRFDEALKACEDYDIYLQLSRKHPVLAHNEPIAAYRKHDQNMSLDNGLMLQETIRVLQKQKPELDHHQMKLLLRGLEGQENRYLGAILKKKRRPGGKGNLTFAEQAACKTHAGQLRKLRHLEIKMALRQWIKKHMPAGISRLLFQLKLIPSYIPPPGKVSAGDFRRLSPFDPHFGFQRGKPVDRIYIEAFLNQHQRDIRGRVLEIGDNTYTVRFGGDQVVQSDVLHVCQTAEKANIHADLSHAPQIPSSQYNCLIVTQTLHLIYDFHAALKTCYRILKPGGTLLLTVPGITQIDQGEWNTGWYWSFTRQSLLKLAEDHFPECQVSVVQKGNLFAAVAFLYGMSAAELKKSEIELDDPAYPLVVLLRVRKPDH